VAGRTPQAVISHGPGRLRVCPGPGHNIPFWAARPGSGKDWYCWGDYGCLVGSISRERAWLTRC
jgi:hypothetical protein